MVSIVLVVALAVLAFIVLAGRLAGTPVTMPMLFTTAGLLLGPAVLDVVRLDVEEVRVRIKAGGDKAVEHRHRIADALAARGADADLAARAHLLRRVETEPPGR